MIKTAENCLFIESVESNLDFFAHHAMECEGTEFLTQWKHFEKYYRLIPGEEDQTYGRHCIRRLMLQSMAHLTVASLVKEKDKGDQEIGKFLFEIFEGKEDPLLDRSLSEWRGDHWKSLKANVERIQRLVIRKDADVGINRKENAYPHPARSRDEKFTGAKLLRMIQLHEALSPIRKSLEEQMSSDENDENAKTLFDIDQNLINEFEKNTEKAKDKFVKKMLEKFLILDESTGDIVLNDRKTLGKVIDFGVRPWSFNDFVKKLFKDFKTWSAIFPGPKLEQYYFPEEAQEDTGFQQSDEEKEDDEEDAPQTAALIQDLRTRRQDLNERVGTDPIHEARTIAANATGQSPSPVKTHRSPAKKRRKKDISKLLLALEKYDSEHEKVSDNDDENLVLRDLPKHAKRKISSVAGSPGSNKKRKSQEKIYEGRRLWTGAEKDAIKRGIDELGLGKWAKVKEMFPVILSQRTSGQIKDCYRTMKRTNEL